MKIIFFDGYCPMCNSWVKRILKWDRKKTFHFAPLDGDAARRLLTPLFPGYIKEDTIIYYDHGKIFLRSDAAIEISKELSFPFRLGSVLKVIPKRWRDVMYNNIAKNRYKYGERFNSCPLPPVEWRERFV